VQVAAPAQMDLAVGHLEQEEAMEVIPQYLVLLH